MNARWGNLRAILAGDFLLARASELAASLGTEVSALLAATIGRLCEGQVRELAHAYDVARCYAVEAADTLNPLGTGPVIDALASLGDALIDRIPAVFA